MKNPESKKTWETPKLIVLVRGRPEELVLKGCKHPATPSGPGGIAEFCKPNNQICKDQSLKS